MEVPGYKVICCVVHDVCGKNTIKYNMCKIKIQITIHFIKYHDILGFKTDGLSGLRNQTNLVYYAYSNSIPFSIVCVCVCDLHG